MARPRTDSANEVLKQLLDQMLAAGDRISARAVAARHPDIKSTSTITRSKARSELIAEYEGRQEAIRRLQARALKRSKMEAAHRIEQMENRIHELEGIVDALLASHRIMMRAVGEAGGAGSLVKLYAKYRCVYEVVQKLQPVDGQGV